MTTLGHHSRLVLLADPNQMIYTFLRQRGVGPQRLARGRAVAGRIVELETRSHRDPSGIIPAMAEAIRRRDFFAQAPREAFRTGRLRVLRDIQDDALPPLIQDEVRRVRAAGARTVGIFGHSNEGVATLGAALEQVGLDHVLVGLPEAHGEALVTLATLCAYSAGRVGLPDVRLALATFLTACTRGDHAPPLAIRLAEGTPLPPALTHRLGEIERRLRQANGGTMAEVISIASRAWEELGITAGIRPWRRACADFAAFARPVAVSPVTVEAAQILVSQAERRRPVALVEFDATRLGPVQLMNFHQTKGREEDAVILVYRTRDYLADRREDEPYEEASRVLFVSLTRARQRVTVILPRDPHPLVAPFVQLA